MSPTNGNGSKALLERAKAIDLTQLFSRYGIELRRSGRGLIGRCPFHEDHTPSLSVTPEKGLWNCFGCDAGGTAIDLVMRLEGVGPIEAAQQLHARDPEGAMPPAAEPPKALTEAQLATLERAAAFYQEGLAQAMKARQVLGERGLLDPPLIERYRIGYGNGRVKEVIDPDIGQALGVLTERGTDRFYRALVFPITDLSGRVVGLYGRGTSRDRHIYLPGPHRGVLGWEAVRDHGHVLIAESVIDCLSAVRLGMPGAIPIYGTGGLTPHHLELLRRYPGREVTLLLDNDPAGHRATERIARRLAALPVKCYAATLPEGVHDLNDLLVRGGTPRELQAIIAARLPISAAQPAPQPEVEPPPQPPAPPPAPIEATRATPPSSNEPNNDGLIRHEDGRAQWQLDGVHYEVRGIRPHCTDAMRLVVSARIDGRRYADRLDLLVGRSRRGFAQQAAERIGREPAQLEAHLEHLVDAIDALKAAARERLRQEEAAPASAPMDEVDRAAALELLESPDILGVVAHDLEQLGYVGEDDAKALLYLVALSRLTDQPLGAIIQSESGTGKSSLMEAVASLVPPEDVLLLSRLTPQALYYMPPGALSHRLLIIDERAGTAGADYSLRTLQSQRRLSLLAPMRDPATGRMQTERIEVEGPIAYMESATSHSPNPENANRCFEITLDGSPDQTGRVHAWQRRAYDPAWWASARDPDAIRRRHQHAQRLLERVPVAIPFADRITFPAQAARTRRDHERFLALIALIALLHQRGRPWHEVPGGARYIEALPADYAAAYRLAHSAIARGLSDRSDDAGALLTEMRALITAKADALGVAPARVPVTRRELRGWTGWSQRRLCRTLEELVELELIDADGCNGRRYEYRLLDGEAPPEPSPNLTSPEEVA